MRLGYGFRRVRITKGFATKRSSSWFGKSQQSKNRKYVKSVKHKGKWHPIWRTKR